MRCSLFEETDVTVLKASAIDVREETVATESARLCSLCSRCATPVELLQVNGVDFLDVSWSCCTWRSGCFRVMPLPANILVCRPSKLLQATDLIGLESGVLATSSLATSLFVQKNLLPMDPNRLVCPFPSVIDYLLHFLAFSAAWWDLKVGHQKGVSSCLSVSVATSLTSRRTEVSAKCWSICLVCRAPRQRSHAFLCSPPGTLLFVDLN